MDNRAGADPSLTYRNTLPRASGVPSIQSIPLKRCSCSVVADDGLGSKHHFVASLVTVPGGGYAQTKVGTRPWRPQRLLKHCTHGVT